MQVHDVAFCNLIIWIKEKAIWYGDIAHCHQCSRLFSSPLSSPPCTGRLWRTFGLGEESCFCDRIRHLILGRLRKLTHMVCFSNPVQLINEPERRHKHTEPVHHWLTRWVTDRTTSDLIQRWKWKLVIWSRPQASSEVLGSFRRFLAGLVDQVVCGLRRPWPSSVLLRYSFAFHSSLGLCFGTLNWFFIPKCVKEFMLSSFRLQSLNQSRQ